MKKLFTITFLIISIDFLNAQINLSPMWQSEDYWKIRTYDGHSDLGIHYAADFYYNNRNRPDIYKNGDIGILGRNILAPIAGSIFIHLLDVTSYGNGQFPQINAVRVFQGIDPIPQNCFSIVDSLGSTIRVDMSLIIDFNSNTKRTNFSHLQIKSSYFNSSVQQKIRNALRKFYNRTAIAPPGGLRREAVSVGSNVTIGTQVGTISNWGIASEPHLHFQLFSGSNYSESNPYLGTAQNLSNSSVVTISNQKILETSYEGTYGNGNYHYPAMLRRSYNINDPIIVNAAWDGGSGAKLRNSPGGSEITTLPNGSTGIILQTNPLHQKLGSNNYLWYNVQFGNNTGWIASEYIELNSNLIPTIIVSKTSLQDFGNVLVGQSSSSQSYTVSGSGLINSMTIEATGGFEISENQSSGFNSLLTYSPSDGTIPIKTIYVRFSPQSEGNYTGNIMHTSHGAIQQNVSVKGKGVTSQSPQIILSTTSLPDFGNVFVDQNSTPQSYTVSGISLTNNLTIEATGGFEISENQNSGFTSVLTYTPSGGTISTKTIYVRFSPQGEGTYTGNIMHTSQGAIQQNVSVKGKGVTSQSPQIILSTTSLPDFGNVFVDQNSTPQSYTVSGINLTNNLTIEATGGFEISENQNSGFTSVLTYTPSGGTVSTKTIYIRFSPLGEGTYTGNIMHTSQGAIQQNIAVKGTGITISPGDFWESTNGPVGETVISLCIDSNDFIFAGTWNSGVFRSTDSGNSWTQINNGFSADYVRSFAINNNYIFAGTYDNGIFRSTNNGDEWTQINNGLNSTTVLSLTVNSNNYIFAGTRWSDGIFRSLDNGDNWSKVANGLPNNAILSLTCNISSNNIFAGTWGSGVYRSENNGYSWTQINVGLTNLDILSLASNSIGDIFAGTGDGVFLSTNNGNNWNQINNGLLINSISCLAINSSGYIFSGTYDGDGGIFQSTNNGNNWISINSGLNILDTVLDIYSLAINSNGYLFAGTEQHGVYRSVQSTLVSVESKKEILTCYGLDQNYPNPFNPTTKINYSIPSLQNVKLSIFDLLGREIATLVNEEKLTGNYTIEFDAAKYNLQSGVYFYRIKTVEFTDTKKLILLK